MEGGTQNKIKQTNFHKNTVFPHLSSSSLGLSCLGEEALLPEEELPGLGDREKVVFQFLNLRLTSSVWMTRLARGQDTHDLLQGGMSNIHNCRLTRDSGVGSAVDRPI